MTAEVSQAPLTAVRSPESFFPLALAMQSESAAMYSDILSVMLNGKVGATLMLPYGRFVVDASILSCDLKAASLIYGCSSSNARRDFCPCGCVGLDKKT